LRLLFFFLVKYKRFLSRQGPSFPPPPHPTAFLYFKICGKSTASNLFLSLSDLLLIYQDSRRTVIPTEGPSFTLSSFLSLDYGKKTGQAVRLVTSPKSSSPSLRGQSKNRPSRSAQFNHTLPLRKRTPQYLPSCFFATLFFDL